MRIFFAEKGSFNQNVRCIDKNWLIGKTSSIIV